MKLSISPARQNKYMENWTVFIKDEPFFARKQVYIHRKVGDQICILNSDGVTETWHPIGTDMGNILPTLQMSGALFQTFVDKIAELGIKPTEGKFIEGRMVATEKHLEDMRRLVFDSKDLVVRAVDAQDLKRIKEY